jgi:poly(3-hydroxybutyrate) depolymerase
MLAPLPSSEAFALRSAMLCGLIHSAAVLTPSAGCTAAAATGTAGAVPPSPPGVAGAHKIHVAEPSSPTGTQSRHFRLRTPASYDPEGTQQQPLPLVMDIHGYTSTSYKQMRNSGFLNISDEMNFIGLWPDGSGDCLSDDPSCEHSWDSCSACNQGWNCLGTTSAQAGPLGPTCNPDRRAWGRYSCYASCGDSCEPRAADNTTDTCISSSCWDDIGFVSEMLDWVEQRLCVDLDHVHVRPLHCRFFTVGQAAHRRCVQVSGLSNGAMMTYYIAHRLSARIASIAPVAGLPLLGYLKQAVPTAPMAVMATNGLLDHVIPANISNGFMGRAGVQRARAGRVTASTVRPARLPDLEKRLARPSAFSTVEKRRWQIHRLTTSRQPLGKPTSAADPVAGACSPTRPRRTAICCGGACCQRATAARPARRSSAAARWRSTYGPPSPTWNARRTHASKSICTARSRNGHVWRGRFSKIIQDCHSKVQPTISSLGWMDGWTYIDTDTREEYTQCHHQRPHLAASAAAYSSAFLRALSPPSPPRAAPPSSPIR